MFLDPELRPFANIRGRYRLAYVCLYSREIDSNELVLTFGGFTSVLNLVKIDQEMRPWEFGDTNRRKLALYFAPRYIKAP